MSPDTETIRFRPGVVDLLDQTRLPGRLVRRECRSVDEVVVAIRELAVRGAPAIGKIGRAHV